MLVFLIARQQLGPSFPFLFFVFHIFHNSRSFPPQGLKSFFQITEVLLYVTCSGQFSNVPDFLGIKVPFMSCFS